MSQTHIVTVPVRAFPDQLDLPADVHRIRCGIANCYLIGEPGTADWVLIDAGMPYYASKITREADRRFHGSPPQAILLTHGHFDHVGSLDALLKQWPGVPVYAHPLELPYLTGISAYPPPDPGVGGGLLARLSPLFPRHACDFSPNIVPLSPDNEVPFLLNWRWYHTPGHSPGHVSFFRDWDRTLIAGDAFVTQKQESLWGAVSQTMEIHGPPMYFTIDWIAAARSVRLLRSLEPHVAATGHGCPMTQPRLDRDLLWLADHFEEVAVPRNGRYVREPAIADQNGVQYVPPKVRDWRPGLIIATAAAAGLLAYIGWRRGRSARRARQGNIRPNPSRQTDARPASDVRTQHRLRSEKIATEPWRLARPLAECRFPAGENVKYSVERVSRE